MKKSGVDNPVLLNRRRFLQVASAAAGTLAIGIKKAKASLERLNPRNVQTTAATTLDEGIKVVHSVCLGCNARCGNRSVVEGGKLVKVSGNPYHPYNSHNNPAEYKTPASETLGLSSPVCGKGQAAPNYVYNPYRLIKPLKRAGERGSGKFEPIEWEQLIKEIADGGRLFAHLGEESDIKGLKALNSDTPIDPDAPELGSIRNSFVFIAGRDQTGRQEFTTRFVKDALGSVNRIGHTDICGLGFRMGNLAFTEGKEVEIKADAMSAEYILVFGANIYEALQPGINSYGAMIAKRYSEGKVKFTIVDPRATNASVHAEDWIQIKPGQDGAFAMGMIRWIIENKRYNRNYLEAPNPMAAKSKGHACYSNAAHLVIADKSNKNNLKFLRVGDINLSATAEEAAAFVVLSKDDSPVAFDKTDEAILDAEATVKDSEGREIKVKTSFRLMKEEVMEHTIGQYAKFAGVERSQIEKTAMEFTSHGTRAAVTQYHGAGNYVSGTYAAYAVAMLNAMIGNIDHKGGYLKAGGGAAQWNEGLYDLKEFTGKKKPQGVPISREKAAYEKSTEFRKKKEAGGTGYPATRPWFKFTAGGLCVESLSGIDQKYPYSCNMLFTYFFNPVYSIPGGYRYIETLKSHDKVPLHLSIDITINESNLYADYIVPDLTYPEGHYGFLTPHAPALKFTGVRTPSIEPLTGKTTDKRHFSLETFLIDLAKAAGLQGFGENAIKGKDGKQYPLNKAEDYYLKGIANLASNAKVQEASEEDLAFVEKNYPVSRFKDTLANVEWKQACHVLARGGIFNLKYEDLFDGDNHKFGLKRVVLYNEELATTRNSLTGEFFSGTLKYIPPVNSKGLALEEVDSDYPFCVITYKMNLHAQSRTTFHSWAMDVFPENFAEINEKDAEKYGLKDNDKVHLVSRSSPKGIAGKVKVTKLIRQGCVGVSNHYGHTQFGASRLPLINCENAYLGGKMVVDKNGLIPDPRLGTGLNSNYLSRLDENLANTPMVDVVAGIPDFSSTQVKIIKT